MIEKITELTNKKIDKVRDEARRVFDISGLKSNCCNVQIEYRGFYYCPKCERGKLNEKQNK